jgi:hypothetical protein
MLRIWRFIALVLTALSMGLSFAHLLELPPKMLFDGQLWVTITTKDLYYLFGSVGAVIEVGSIVTAIVLAFLMRDRGLVFAFTLGGAILLALALALWFVFIAPVNAQLAKWTSTSFPSDWMRYRDRWEYAHAINAIIKLVAFGLLICSILVETPSTVRSYCVSFADRLRQFGSVVATAPQSWCKLKTLSRFLCLMSVSLLSAQAKSRRDLAITIGLERIPRSLGDGGRLSIRS